MLSGREVYGFEARRNNQGYIIKSVKFFIRVFAIFVLQLCLTNCNRANDVVRIGVLFPLTGDASGYGEKGKKAIELAVDDVNSSGGIHGRKVVAIFEDSRADSRIGVTAAQRLISINKVPAIVGDIVSSVTLPIAPICEKNEVVLIAPTSSAPAITDAGEYIYRVWPSDLAEGSAAGEFARKKGFKRVAIMHLNNDYGNAIAEVFEKSYTGGDASVVVSISYTPDDTSFQSSLSRIRSLNADAIYLAGYYADIARILKQAKELGINAQFIGVTALEDSEFLKIAGDAAEGVVYPLATGFDPVNGAEESKIFAQNFSKRFNYEPGWVESHCYDAFMLIAHGLKSSKAMTGSDVKSFLDNMGVYKGVTGDVVFDANGDVVKPVRFKIVKGCKFEELDLGEQVFCE